MKRRHFLLGGGVAAGAAALVATSPAHHESMIIGAMPPGSSWYVFAATLAQMLESKLGSSTSIEIFARGGGTGNPALVERGKATIALCQVATALWAWDGLPLAFRGVQHRRIRALVGGLNSVWMTAVARNQYIAASGNDTLEKALRATPAPRIIMKPPGSTVPVVADMIFDFFGTSRTAIRARGGDIIQVAVNQIPDMLADGRADIYFETAIKGHPALTEAATTAGIRFLDFPQPLLDSLARNGMTPRPLPAWFRGQVKPTAAVDCGTVLITRDDLPEATAHMITQTLCEGRERMVKAHKAWSDFDPPSSGGRLATGIPLHPGAQRYYREKGWLAAAPA